MTKNLDVVKFAKITESAKIPTKRDEDAGYDIYANFEEDCVIIPPSETVMVPTGIASAFSDDYYFQIHERGSTGGKGMATRAGVLDSGYRGEWLVPITNVNSHFVIIAKEGVTTEEIFGAVMPANVEMYPYEKGIAQAILHTVPKVEVEEVSLSDLQSIPSQRGSGKLGSSNK